MKSHLFATLFIITSFSLALSSCNYPPQENSTNGVSLHSELGGKAEGFERACSAREFSFPEDHGAHPAYRNEWWYITGNLENSAGLRFGFHVTFFRVANPPATPTDNRHSSHWVSKEFYMAHFAMTEGLTGQTAANSSSFERFSRAAAGLSGAQVSNTNLNTVKVWLDDWQLNARQVNDKLVWQLSLKEGDYSLQMNLTPEKPVVLQGNAGYSQKSAHPCNASYYYSIPRLRADGQIMVAGKKHDVTGSAWLDREWSSSALADTQTGWDWFAIQLNDGRDLMLYNLRQTDGGIDPYSYAVEIDRQGNKRQIPIDQIVIEIQHWWQSDSGSRYPVAGTIHRKDTGEVLVFTPLKENQELDFTVRYWEGAIDLTNINGEKIGHGYLELTGY